MGAYLSSITYVLLIQNFASINPTAKEKVEFERWSTLIILVLTHMFGGETRKRQAASLKVESYSAL
jgi:hypothetical protein